MTRKEGIVRQRTKLFPKKPLPKGKNWEQLFNTEYLNYEELCFYCGEKHLSFEEWLAQQIKPA